MSSSIYRLFREDLQKLIDENADFWDSFYLALLPEAEVNVKPITKKILRKHQQEAKDAVAGVNKGIIILPTGSGKSLIEAAVIEDTIAKNPRAVCVIATPRIVLTYQLISTTFEYLVSDQISAKYVNLNTGKMDDDDLKRAMRKYGVVVSGVISTTDPKVLSDLYQNSNGPIIIGATYQSIGRLLETDIPIDLFICDEAHNLVTSIGRFSEQAKGDAHAIQANSKLFFTATEAHSEGDNSTGMNNSELFGNVIFRKSPREMIEVGEIVRPFIHIIKIDDKWKLTSTDGFDYDDIENNIEVASIFVEQGFLEHQKTVRQNCSLAKSDGQEKIGSKLLVVCRGNPAMLGFLGCDPEVKQSDVMRRFMEEHKDVKIYGISSEAGAYLNGRLIPSGGNDFKEMFMSELQNLKDEDDVIIFHIDMLAEGIDVPGITGIMSFRDLGNIKACQTFGRAMRLHRKDRQNIYSGNISANEYEKMIKPCAWVIIPMLASLESKNGYGRMQKLAVQMRTEYGFNPLEYANGGAMIGSSEAVQKDIKLFGSEPWEVELYHEIDNPNFIKDVWEEAEKSGREMMSSIKIVKHIKPNNRRK